MNGGPLFVANQTWSSSFQWLPCNFSSLDGVSASIESYSNSMHPVDHRGLDYIFENGVSIVVLLWNTIYQCPHDGIFGKRTRIYFKETTYELPEGVDEDPLDKFDGDMDESIEEIQKLCTLTKPEPKPEDRSNIHLVPTDSTLSLRTKVNPMNCNESVPYEQHDHFSVEDIIGSRKTTKACKSSAPA